jgi:hypothetical protein
VEINLEPGALLAWELGGHLVPSPTWQTLNWQSATTASAAGALPLGCPLLQPSKSETVWIKCWRMAGFCTTGAFVDAPTSS